METYIKLYRKLTKWEWYQDSQMVHLFVHLLISANRYPGRWQGIDIGTGQLVTGLYSLKGATGMSIQKIRTRLQKLKDSGEITIQSTNRFSIITLSNYSKYQCEENDNKQTNKQITIKQQTNNNKQESKRKIKKEKKNPPTPQGGKEKVKTPTDLQKIVNRFFELKGWDGKDKEFYQKNKIIYGRFVKPAKDLLEIATAEGGDVRLAIERLEQVASWATSRDLDWSLETVLKKYLDADKLTEKEKTPHFKGQKMYQRGGKWWVVTANGEHLEYGFRIKSNDKNISYE